MPPQFRLGGHRLSRIAICLGSEIFGCSDRSFGTSMASVADHKPSSSFLTCSHGIFSSASAMVAALISSADTGAIQTRAAKTDRAKRIGMNHLLGGGSRKVDRPSTQRNAESDIAAEPSDDEIAAPHIESTAKASTKGAATTFLRNLKLRQANR